MRARESTYSKLLTFGYEPPLIRRMPTSPLSRGPITASAWGALVMRRGTAFARLWFSTMTNPQLTRVVREQWKAVHHQRRSRHIALDLFEAGDVVMCIRDAPGYLKRGCLYRVREKVPYCHAYWLEGIEGVGFWAGRRLERAIASYTRSGPIQREVHHD